MREKIISALRVVTMAGLTALICGVIAIIGIADYPSEGQGVWANVESHAFVSLLVTGVVWVCLLTLGQLYGWLFAKMGWLSLRNTVLVGITVQALLCVFVVDSSVQGGGGGLIHSYLREWFLDEELPWSEARDELRAQISTAADWIQEALVTSPASIGLVLFYALHLRRKVTQPTMLDQ